MEFDAAFYLRENPDVAAAGVDPLTHFRSNGWREGRDPHPAFDTRFYLARLGGALPDGVDPLTHWLTVGALEGRPTAPPPDPALRAMMSAFDRPAPPVPALPDSATLQADALAALLRPALVARREILVSVGHDAFVRSVGGVQLVTAAEQLRCTGDHGLHVHLSPVTAWPRLRPLNGPAVLLTILLDGVDIGTATMATLCRALGSVERPETRIVVHSLLGHRPEEIGAMADALAAPVTVWLHDYSTLCEAPQLLRNGYAFCGAPPVRSVACAVCVHGATRADTMARSSALCGRAEMLAPSETVSAIWGGPVVVTPHGVLEPATPALRRHGEGCGKLLPPASGGRIGVGVGPRIAFVGTPAFHKGYGWAKALNATHLSARTSVADPWATARALADAAIDLVLILSPWPETFCLVAHEAIAAGCDLLTLAASGHAAALVRQTGRGIVFDDVAAVGDWLEHEADAWVAARRAHPPEPLGFRWSGFLSDDPDPVLLDDATVLPRQSLGPMVWGFSRPSPNGVLTLRSRWFVPNWRRPEPYDDRRLGLAVTSIELDGQPVDLAALTNGWRSGGWHPGEAGLRWTDGHATFDAGRARKILVRGAAGGRYPARA